MQIPNKLMFGDNWKQGSIKTINAIIDYLKTQRLVGDNKTISITQGVNGLSISALPQTVKPNQKSGSATVVIGEGAAVPAIITSAMAQGAIYQVALYPDGYGGKGVQGAYYALPTSVSFMRRPPIGSHIIVFKAYIDAVGGDEAGITQEG